MTLAAKAAGCLAVAYVTWFALICRPGGRSTSAWGPRWLATAASGVLFRFGNWYLSFTIDTEEAVKAGKFDKSKQYVVIWHPHGAFTISALYFFSHYSAGSLIFPKFYCAVASFLLQIPFLAEFLLLCNSRSFDNKTLSRLLAGGNTVGIQPGGIYEQVHTDHLREAIYFSGNLGFVRLAIKHGVPLLPLYAFGENQLYDTSDFLRNINIWLYKTFKVGNLFVHSGHCWGIPVTPALPNPLLLPVPGRNLNVRWGEAVEVGAADEHPSDEKVQEVFDRYVAAVKKVFDEHKDACLPKHVAEKGLTVVVRGKGGGNNK